MAEAFYIQNLGSGKWTVPRSDGSLEQWSMTPYLYAEGNSQGSVKVTVFKEFGDKRSSKMLLLSKLLELNPDAKKFLIGKPLDPKMVELLEGSGHVEFV